MRRIRIFVFVPLLLAALATQGPLTTRALTPTVSPTATAVTEDPSEVATETETATVIPTGTSTETAVPESTLTATESATGTSTAIPEPTFDPCQVQNESRSSVDPAGQLICATATSTPEASGTAAGTEEPESTATVRPTYDTEISDPATLLPDTGSTDPTIVAGATLEPTNSKLDEVTSLPNAGSGESGSSSPAWLLVVAAFLALTVLVRTLHRQSRS